MIVAVGVFILSVVIAVVLLRWLDCIDAKNAAQIAKMERIYAAFLRERDKLREGLK